MLILSWRVRTLMLELLQLVVADLAESVAYLQVTSGAIFDEAHSTMLRFNRRYLVQLQV